MLAAQVIRLFSIDSANMWWFVFSVLVVVVVCEKNDTESAVRGVLTPDCVANYFRIYVTGRVPPRNYQYYHEMLLNGYEKSGPDHGKFLSDGNAVSMLRAAQVSWRIVGGTTIDITEAPYQVLYGLYCGGTLIAPDWVITAAHCKDKEDFIYTGSTYRSKGTPYRICAHFTHPLWNADNKMHPHDFDYQLVLLERPVPITPMSRPIEIGNMEDIRPGSMVYVSGWGHVSYKKSAMQDILRRVAVPILMDEVCKAMPNQNYKLITPRMFCAGFLNGTKDSCQGDSGGPVVFEGRLIGLVSFGVGCAMPDQPGVYSIIPYVRDWIRSITALPL